MELCREHIPDFRDTALVSETVTLYFLSTKKMLSFKSQVILNVIQLSWHNFHHVLQLWTVRGTKRVSAKSQTKPSFKLANLFAILQSESNVYFQSWTTIIVPMHSNACTRKIDLVLHWCLLVWGLHFFAQTIQTGERPEGHVVDDFVHRIDEPEDSGAFVHAEYGQHGKASPLAVSGFLAHHADTRPQRARVAFWSRPTQIPAASF